jgi:GTPase SAR1 family protein
MYPNQNKISVLMLGDGAVGKTSLLKMYAEGTFQESHMATMGLDYISKAFTPNDSDTEIPVKIWDTAG